MATNEKKINHLLWRAGFGPSLTQAKRFRTTGEALQSLLDDAKSIRQLNMILPETYQRGNMKGASKEEIKQMRMQSREQLRDLNTAWQQQLFSDECALREKMTLFWHGHLACRPESAFYAQDYINVIRKNAMGKYGDLLTGVVKSPAMMRYLDVMRNKKDSPNENFARELMELFTLGKGNYTEADVKNAARAFTGWAYIPSNGFTVRENQHDSGSKKIFGKSGNFTGDDVIRMILQNRQTAHHVTGKIYKHFVNPVVNEARVKVLADSFYASGYDIEQLMKEIFTAEWFYEEENIGVKIKSPIELISGLTRSFNITYANPSALQVAQRIMGQELLSPPNVAGWPGGKNWIDSSALMYRLDLGNLALGQSSYEIVPKGDVEEMNTTDMNRMEVKGKLRQLKPTADWNQYQILFADVPEEKVYFSVSEYLIQAKHIQPQQSIIDSFTNHSSKEEYVQSLSMRLLALPEYQMC